MADEKPTPSLVVRVLQGVILGVVLAIPVVFWGLSRADAAAENPDAAARPQAEPKTLRRVRPAPTRPAAPSVSKPKADAETIPAARMHISIDDGSKGVRATPIVAITPKDEIE